MFRHAVKIARIAGVELALDYSWFIIFFLVTWSLASHSMARYPDWARALHWVAAVATSLGFFASVVAHEMAHSLVAKRYGIAVRRITLFVFGGASEIRGEPGRPRDEFVMALVGPLTSFTVSGLCFIVFLLIGRVSEPVAAVARWLGTVNLALGLFNLIPGFPLDGGRVLRSLIWHTTGNLRRATFVATSIGRTVAFSFIFAGVYLALFRGRWVNGLWIAFIGWFLENAGTASYRQMALREILHGHVAGEIMRTDCRLIDGSIPVEKLVYDYILPGTRHSFPVVSEGRVVGLVTLKNVKDVARNQWSAMTVRQAMTPLSELKRVDRDTPLVSLMELMSGEEINEVPVVDGANFAGVVRWADVIAFVHARSELGL